MFYIWLKSIDSANPPDWFARLPREKYGKGLKTDETTGQQYVDLGADDPLDPTARFLQVPDEAIDCVTYRGTINRGLRVEGTYYFGLAQIYVRTERRWHDGNFQVPDQLEETQDIHASAATVRELQAALREFRKGTGMPQDNFEAAQFQAVQVISFDRRLNIQH